MLTELSIRNIAIIEKLQISFGAGLNILTGETGAGKSIIIDSLSLVTGGRATADLIRAGEEEAVVEAIFDLSQLPDVLQLLAEGGIESDGELLVRRIVSRTGRNRIYLNGSLATLTQLSEIGRRLVTIHGQHESQALLRPESHLQLLDSFAGSEQLLREYSAAFGQWQKLEQQLAGFGEQELEAAHRLDLISFQCDEIKNAALKPGEDGELAEEQRLLAHAGRLAAVSSSAFEALYGGDHTLLGDLRRISDSVRDAAAIDPLLNPISELMTESFHQLEDASLQLRDYAGRIEADPVRLQELEDRLDLIARMKKKYGSTIEEINRLGAALAEEQESLKGRCRSRDELEQECAKALAVLEQLGTELTDLRTKAARQLATNLVNEVRQLAMPHAVVEVAFETCQQPRPSGFERVEFLFSPNPGEQPRPWAASPQGGTFPPDACLQAGAAGRGSTHPGF